MFRVKPVQKVCVAYATETGNSFEMAVHFCTSVVNLVDEFGPLEQNYKLQNNCLYIIFVSTTGQGDPPYQMRGFWKKIMSKSYPKIQEVRFAVFGLGDRSYGDNFNIAARKLRQRLIMLEAQEIGDCGLGDQQQSNGCFGEYFKNFYPVLKSYVEQVKINKSKINFETKMFSDKRHNIKNKIEKQKYGFWQISQCQSLNTLKGRQTFWVTFNNPTQTQIKLGSTLQILPFNNNKVVQQMMDYFKNNSLIDIQIKDEQLEQYLKCSANLSNLVNFTFFEGLFNFVSNSLQPQTINLFKDKLIQLRESYDEYFNYIKKYKRNVREVISDFSLKVPLSYFITKLSTIISRKYSIAHIDNTKKQISLLVKLQQSKISNNRIVPGLCSYDLTQMPVGKKRLAKVIPDGEFSIDEKTIQPSKIAMVSLGTGIAPFLSILNWSFSHHLPHKMCLFHSTRFLTEVPFQSTLLEHLTSENKLKSFLSFTREPLPTQNRHLQLIVEQNAAIFQEYSEGKIMICGVKQFCDAICNILARCLNWDIKQMRKKGIICVQNW